MPLNYLLKFGYESVFMNILYSHHMYIRLWMIMFVVTEELWRKRLRIMYGWLWKIWWLTYKRSETQQKSHSGSIVDQLIGWYTHKESDWLVCWLITVSYGILKTHVDYSPLRCLLCAFFAHFWPVAYFAKFSISLLKAVVLFVGITDEKVAWKR